MKGKFSAGVKRFLHDNVYINKVPSYGNTIFYSFGMILITLFLFLGVTGILLAFAGSSWWLSSGIGTYVRSVHMWAAQAFLLFLLLHLLVTFSTSAFKHKKVVWLVGVAMFFLFIIQTEFGYTIRNDFSSQWRALQGADFWNGNILGHLVNPLNYSQAFFIHILLIPLVLVIAVIIHYGIVRAKGLSKPYKKGIKYKMVEANHKVLYIRALIIIAVVLLLGFILPSPTMPQATLKQVSTQSPSAFAHTVIEEYTHASDTAMYDDTIDPYTFDTRTVFVTDPYKAYIKSSGKKDRLSQFEAAPLKAQGTYLNTAASYFKANGSLDESNSNPMISVASSLTIMAQSGLYGAELRTDLPQDNPTIAYRMLSDTGYMDAKANTLGLSLENYGMLKDEKGGGIFPPNSWWMAPINLLDNTVLKNDPNQDRDNAEVVGILLLLLATLPWLPFVREIPDKLRLYLLFWRKG